MKQAERDSTVVPITGQKVRFPGVSGEIDSPFQIVDGLPLGPGLKEAEQLLDMAWDFLERVGDDLNDSDLKTLNFLLLSGSTIVTSLSRGFEKHPLSKGPDGFHAHPEDPASWAPPAAPTMPDSGFDILFHVQESKTLEILVKRARVPFIPRVGDFITPAADEDPGEVARIYWTPDDGFEVWFQNLDHYENLRACGWLTFEELRKAEQARQSQD